MSHIFVSYSHSDRTQLENFIRQLTQAGFKDDGEDKDIWIDTSSIEGGEDWRNEIDKALEESFAVVILLTKNSFLSNFVLYEWTWALGNSTRVFPILVENIEDNDFPTDFKHPLYERKQYKKWDIPSDQAYVIDQLKDLRQLSPLDIFLGQAISDIVLPARTLSHFALWCYPYANKNQVISHEDFYYLLEQAVLETNKCYTQRLRDFWLDKSSAFNRRQKRLYAKLIKELEQFWDLLTKLHFVTQSGFQDDISYLNYEEKSLSEIVTKLTAFQEQNLNETISSLNANPTNFKEFSSYLLKVSSKNYAYRRLEELRFFSAGIDFVLESLPQTEQERIEEVIKLIIQQ